MTAPLTTDSRSLQTIEVSDTWRYFSAIFLLPYVMIGDTVAIFQSAGMHPLCKLLLKMLLAAWQTHIIGVDEFRQSRIPDSTTTMDLRCIPLVEHRQG